MAEPESTNTMLHDSFVKLADGSYAQQTAARIDGGSGASGVSNTTSATDGAAVAAPAAGATIATTASLAAGTYDVEVITFISGTTVANLENLNMRLLGGATAIARILNPVPGTTGATTTGSIRARIVLATSGTISVVAVATATAASLYSASIVARRVV